ncbi:MAG: TetR/AcrR family transcriptional regulator [Roseibium sp.]|nr:TetR/AcrR family transcriptional regulator [Roseibium sp.]
MSEQAGRPGRRELNAQRRRLIAEAAAECFIEKGFHQTSIRDIARKAGVSLGNLYNHFDSKHALIAEIAALEADELDSVEMALNASDQPDLALKQFAEAYLDLASQPEIAVLTAEIAAEAMRNAEISSLFNTNRARLAKSVEMVLSKGVDCGRFDAGLEPGETAWQILDLLDGVAMRMAFSKKNAAHQSRRSAVNLIDRVVSRLLESRC